MHTWITAVGCRRSCAKASRGPIYAHAATRNLARILLMDAAELARKDFETAERKHRDLGDEPPVRH